MTENINKKVEALTFWQMPILCEPVKGGITNLNFRVEHGNEMFFVRLGEDIPEHGVYRFNELAASRAAFACEISPEVVHAESGAMVLRFIEGKTLVEEDLRDFSNLKKVLSLLKKCHREMTQHLPGSTLIFWAFQVIRCYAKPLREVAKKIPADRLLVETDCPYLTPMPFRGKPNSPAYTYYVAEKLAEIRNTSISEIAKVTTENFNRLFFS